MKKLGLFACGAVFGAAVTYVASNWKAIVEKAKTSYNEAKEKIEAKRAKTEVDQMAQEAGDL
jgi:hypothetical protein